MEEELPTPSKALRKSLRGGLKVTPRKRLALEKLPLLASKDGETPVKGSAKRSPLVPYTSDSDDTAGDVPASQVEASTVGEDSYSQWRSGTAVGGPGEEEHDRITRATSSGGSAPHRDIDIDLLDRELEEENLDDQIRLQEQEARRRRREDGRTSVEREKDAFFGVAGTVGDAIIASLPDEW